jgi:hypothetical protein
MPDTEANQVLAPAKKPAKPNGFKIGQVVM